MNRKHAGEHGLGCDDCAAEFWGGTSDFRETIENAKTAGWKIRKEGDNWTHICPECEAD